MAYKEHFDTMVDFRPQYPQQYQPIPQLEAKPEAINKSVDPQEFELFKKYMDFCQEREILLKYEKQGLITFRRQAMPEPITTKDETKEIGDGVIVAIMIGGFIVFLKFVMLVL